MFATQRESLCRTGNAAPGTLGTASGGARPGCELFPQPGDVFRGQAVAGEPVIAETVEPLSCVREVLGSQAGVQGRREAGELRGAVAAGEGGGDVDVVALGRP